MSGHLCFASLARLPDRSTKCRPASAGASNRAVGPASNPFSSGLLPSGIGMVKPTIQQARDRAEVLVFHHHATMCIAAYGFLISEREMIPPLRTSSHHAVPDGCDTQPLSTQGIPPLRPERHIANSIATTRVRLINALIKTFPRCPCCGANAVKHRRRKLLRSKIRGRYTPGMGHERRFPGSSVNGRPKRARECLLKVMSADRALARRTSGTGPISAARKPMIG
jgi:hypothetical protein